MKESAGEPCEHISVDVRGVVVSPAILGQSSLIRPFSIVGTMDYKDGKYHYESAFEADQASTKR